MAGKQINPKLIQALTNEPLSKIPTNPTFKHLGGTYVKSIVDQLKRISTPQPKNDMLMICGKCGQSGTYDVGILCVSIDDKDKPKRQLTGYFRCKHCHADGPWKESPELLMLGMTALMMPDADLPVQFGSTVNLQSTKLPDTLLLSSEDITTFYPLAEAFMGKRAAELYGDVKQKKMTKSQRVEASILAQQGSFTKADLEREFPDISASTISKVLRDLRKAGNVEMADNNYAKQ